MDDDTLERLLREIEEARQLKKRRQEHTYVEDLIRLLLPWKDGLPRGVSCSPALRDSAGMTACLFQRASSRLFRAPTTRTAWIPLSSRNGAVPTRQHHSSRPRVRDRGYGLSTPSGPRSGSGGVGAATMSEPTRGRIDTDGLLQMLLAVGRVLGAGLFMIYLFGGLLAGLTMLIVGEKRQPIGRLAGNILHRL